MRAGASAEVIATDTGWPLDKVLRYAEPLLAERAFIAEQAQSVEVRRSGGGTTLAASAAAVLGTGPDAIAWDARRRDDGKWIVTATFAERKATRIAHWTYDHQGRNLHPMDDTARALMGVGAIEDPPADVAEGEQPVERPKSSRSRPRLVAVPNDPDADSEPSAAEAARAETVAIPTASVTADEPTPVPRTAPAKPAKGKRGRASVPSWDEILFGSPHEE